MQVVYPWDYEHGFIDHFCNHGGSGLKIPGFSAQSNDNHAATKLPVLLRDTYFCPDNLSEHAALINVCYQQPGTLKLSNKGKVDNVALYEI